MVVERFELEAGGSYRFIHKDQDRAEYAFHGVHHEVSPPIVTFSPDGVCHGQAEEVTTS
jgi:hypothetical protein